MERHRPSDAPAAYEALIAFATKPDQAVGLLRDRLPPTKSLPRVTLEQTVADLNSDAFATRERAMKELEKLGRHEAPGLRGLAAKAESLEVKRRLTQVIDRLESGVLWPDELRAVRSLEFLENIGTTAACVLIGELAKGEPTADLTVQAQSARGRLDRRKY